MMINRAGFTLIEVMVSVAILAFISLFTVQAIQRALSTRTKIQRDVDRSSTLRDALRVIERDINLAFNYRDISIEVFNQAQLARKKAADAKSVASAGSGPNGLPLPPQPPVAANPADVTKYALKTDKILTVFLGEKDHLDFTTLSNVRLMDDQPISSQAEVGYFTKACRRRATQEQVPKCLWRRVSNYIHDDITKFGDETVLLENITDFKLRYLGPGHDDEWIDTWLSSEARGDDTTKGKFPFAVEVTVEISEPTGTGKEKKLRMTTVASIRNPNNPTSTDPNNPDGPPVAAQTTGQPGQPATTSPATTTNTSTTRSTP